MVGNMKETRAKQQRKRKRIVFKVQEESSFKATPQKTKSMQGPNQLYISSVKSKGHTVLSKSKRGLTGDEGDDFARGKYFSGDLLNSLAESVLASSGTSIFPNSSFSSAPVSPWTTTTGFEEERLKACRVSESALSTFLFVRLNEEVVWGLDFVELGAVEWGLGRSLRSIGAPREEFPFKIEAVDANLVSNTNKY